MKKNADLQILGDFIKAFILYCIAIFVSYVLCIELIIVTEQSYLN
jgi:hypothetical protein